MKPLDLSEKEELMQTCVHNVDSWNNEIAPYLNFRFLDTESSYTVELFVFMYIHSIGVTAKGSIVHFYLMKQYFILFVALVGARPLVTRSVSGLLALSQTNASFDNNDVSFSNILCWKFLNLLWFLFQDSSDLKCQRKWQRSLCEASWA